MQETKWWLALLKSMAVLMVIGVTIILYTISKIGYNDYQQTIVLGKFNERPESAVSLRIVGQDYSSTQIFGQFDSLSTETIHNALSLLAAEEDAIFFDSKPSTLHLPDDVIVGQNPVFAVKTQSPQGETMITRPIPVRQFTRVLLTTDKPFYEPGQTISIRAVVLNGFDLTALQHTSIIFQIESSDGTTLLRAIGVTSEFGVATFNFTIPYQIHQGQYTLQAIVSEGFTSQNSLGDTEKNIEIRLPSSPKFNIEINTHQTFYLPGQLVKGYVQANQAYGRPIANSLVQLMGVIYTPEQQIVINSSGYTDHNGYYQFQFQLPDNHLTTNVAINTLNLEAMVTNQAHQTEEKQVAIPISTTPIIIEAVPQTISFNHSITNTLHLFTTYPDGQPALTTLYVALGDEQIVIDTNELGLVKIKVVPSETNLSDQLRIKAIDNNGLVGTNNFELFNHTQFKDILLRPNQTTYVVGDTMFLTTFTPANVGNIYLDIIQEGQKIITQVANIEQGFAQFQVEASPDMIGTIEFHTYRLLPDGELIQDTRQVVIDAPQHDISYNLSLHSVPLS